MRTVSMAKNVNFFEATAKRRSLRKLQDASTISDDTIVSLAETAIANTPSAFNSQTTRLTVLLHDQHKALWSLTSDLMMKKLGAERYNAGGTRDKINGFASSYGTILFWDDQSAVEAAKAAAPDIYKDKMEDWMHQSNGMHQYYLWTALEALGLGANLQHYNPLIDATVQKEWNLPTEWRLRAQMVFGTPTPGVPLPEKEQKLPVKDRVGIFGLL